ncbi:MAG TPA: hypothetical protein VGS16_01625 [Candidatus Dormibacteraeota bacterium]|nr:hypothetical protein [Candidatus Dormibacteraeota bacterium]
MEARTQYRESRISKGLVAIVLVSVTLGLGVMAGTVAKNLSGSTTAVQSHSVVAGKGAPAQLATRGHGVQFVQSVAAPKAKAVGPDDRATTSTAPGNSFLGPDAQDRNSKLRGPVNHFGPRESRYI